MPVNDWKNQLESIRRNCERLDAVLGRSADDKTLDRFEIGAPATEDEILETEKYLGFKLPLSFRNVLLHFAKSFDVIWSVPFGKSISLSKKDVRWGRCCWNLGEMINFNGKMYDHLIESFEEIEGEDEKTKKRRLRYLNNAKSQRIWHGIGNGDALLFGIGDENKQEISYYMHDLFDGGPEDDLGECLGKNFEDFIDRWIRIAFIGPEEWELWPFLGKNGVDPDSELSKEFQKKFFVD